VLILYFRPPILRVYPAPGDVVSFGPGEKHWHGASPKTAMSHIAIQEALNGSPVEWTEKVADEQYGDRAAKGE
jgi:hypothetical protein